jgi:periplasmic divalent cation tolerance protein
MKQESPVVVFITAGSPGEAERIAESLLKQRQAACINTVSEVHSRFWWQNRLESAQEHLLIVKTRESLLPRIVESVKKLHHDNVPEIIVLPIIGGNPDYLDWISGEVI